MNTTYTKKDEHTLLKATPISLDIGALYESRALKMQLVEESMKNLAQHQKELAEINKDIAEAEKLGITKEVTEEV